LFYILNKNESELIFDLSGLKQQHIHIDCNLYT